MPTRLSTYPGLTSTEDGKGFFEHAYDAGDGLVARVRFAPQQVEPAAHSAGANMPIVPWALNVLVSASLVDEEGQVLKVAGLGLVRDPINQTWQFDSGEEFNADAWMDSMADQAIDELLRAYRALTSATMFLVPPPDPLPA